MPIAYTQSETYVLYNSNEITSMAVCSISLFAHIHKFTFAWISVGLQQLDIPFEESA